MKTIHIDKIGSVAKCFDLENDLEISEVIKPVEGLLIAGEVLEDKSQYNQLELPSGRFSILKKGDIGVFALGNRRALKGFVGDIPQQLKVNDVIQVLNLGGVAGICTGENVNEVGHALPIKVLGAIVQNNIVLNIKQKALFTSAVNLLSDIPLIVVSGTCMNVGKTSVACEVIAHAAKNGKKVYAAKLAGVACLKDTEKMKDYGAKKVVSFLEAGLTSTVKQNGQIIGITKGALNYLSQEKPDLIVVEFGDGVYGEYGVKEVLQDSQIQKNIVVHIGCAHDPMGAVKLYEVCQELGAPIDIISGPVTDNSVGKNFIENNLKIPAINAFFYNPNLFQFFHQKCHQK